MTAKEKAEQLVNKFTPFVDPKIGIEQYYLLRMGKQCALIAVDEIINSHLLSEKNIFDVHPVDYWQEVKQEIEQL